MRQRKRLWLLTYPKDWRLSHEEEFVGLIEELLLDGNPRWRLFSNALIGGITLRFRLKALQIGFGVMYAALSLLVVVAMNTPNLVVKSVATIENTWSAYQAHMGAQLICRSTDGITLKEFRGKAPPSVLHCEK